MKKLFIIMSIFCATTIHTMKKDKKPPRVYKKKEAALPASVQGPNPFFPQFERESSRLDMPALTPLSVNLPNEKDHDTTGCICTACLAHTLFTLQNLQRQMKAAQDDKCLSQDHHAFIEAIAKEIPDVQKALEKRPHQEIAPEIKRNIAQYKAKAHSSHGIMGILEKSNKK